MTALSRSRVLDYLHGFLKLVDVENKLKHDKLGLLNEIVEQFHAKVPYQNFRLLATTPSKRRVLPLCDIIQDSLKGRGGTCYALNRFMNVILWSLGYDCILNGCLLSYNRELPNHHVINVVQAVRQPDDMYLVDAGTWYPTLQAVPLHTLGNDKNETIYKNRFLEFKLTRHNDDFIRYHRKGPVDVFLDQNVNEDGEWKSYYSFPLEPTGMSEIDDCMNSNYRKASNAILKGFAFAVYPPGKAVTLSHFTLREWDESKQQLDERDLQSVEEVCEVITGICPGIDKTLINHAYENVQLYGSETVGKKDDASQS